MVKTRQLPPLETRFPVNRQDRTKTGPQLGTILKKILNKKIEIDDPKVTAFFKKSFKKISVKKLIMIRYALNAMSGDNTAIQGIMDRIDGKLKMNGKEEGEGPKLRMTIEEKDGRVKRLTKYYQS